MCDTIEALGNSPAEGSVIFGKKSDREPNKAPEVVIIPAGRHENTTTLPSTGGLMELEKAEEMKR